MSSPSPALAASENIEFKEAKLREIVRGLEGGVVVAFSGGVDSALLLMICAQELGTKVIAATAESPSFPEQDRRDARRIARELGVVQVVVETSEIDDPRYRVNDPMRCYFCKHSLFETLTPLARSSGLSHLAFGANLDDSGDYRPGHQAAKEFSVRAPLLEAGFTKQDIRALGRRLGLSIADKPASACLASRVPYGTAIDPAILHRIDLAEEHLRSLGLSQLRVRHHGDVARIEIGRDEFPTAVAVRDAIDAKLKELGWLYVALDLGGYQSGSMNKALPKSRDAHV